jgi:hypothetical protein
MNLAISCAQPAPRLPTKQRRVNPGEWIMMAFMFFLLWMLASLALLTLWVFRQTPPTAQDATSAAEG